jgi:hypothetical protein
LFANRRVDFSIVRAKRGPNIWFVAVMRRRPSAADGICDRHSLEQSGPDERLVSKNVIIVAVLVTAQPPLPDFDEHKRTVRNAAYAACSETGVEADC